MSKSKRKRKKGLPTVRLFPSFVDALKAGYAVTPEPSRDPNPFHHAAELVRHMDRHDLVQLGHLVLERLEEEHAAKGFKSVTGSEYVFE